VQQFLVKSGYWPPNPVGSGRSGAFVRHSAEASAAQSKEKTAVFLKLFGVLTAHPQHGQAAAAFSRETDNAARPRRHRRADFPARTWPWAIVTGEIAEFSRLDALLKIGHDGGHVQKRESPNNGRQFINTT
jgi:hypothetical protein